jgi:hypothetical protein
VIRACSDEIGVAWCPRERPWPSDVAIRPKVGSVGVVTGGRQILPPASGTPDMVRFVPGQPVLAETGGL